LIRATSGADYDSVGMGTTLSANSAKFRKTQQSLHPPRFREFRNLLLKRDLRRFVKYQTIS
jgi:hypothetical protein